MPEGKVLVVDDEPDVLHLCRRILERAGYETWGSSNGQEAIVLARGSTFDVLLTDINMPGMRGLDVAEAVKESNPDIACVTMTGYGTMDLAIEALQLGIDDFVVKPFDAEALTATVSRAVDKQRLRRENARLQALIPLFELSRTFMSATAVEDVLRQVADIARLETGADRVSLVLFPAASSNLDDGTWTTSPSPLGPEQERTDAELARQVVRSRAQVATLSGAAPVRAVGTPLLVKGHLIGVLSAVKNGTNRTFRESDAELLSVLSSQAAIAIQNARLFEQIQQAYEELKELDRMKSEFVNIAAHELRTPLAILLGYLGIVTEAVQGETRERIQVATRNALRLRSIIDDMLDLRQLELRRSELHVEMFSVLDATRSVIDDLMPLARDKQQTITLTVSPGVGNVRTDARKFRLILTNLLSNAIKFSRDQGKIGIDVTRTGRLLAVCVTDDGIGIPVDQHERIFSRFYQVEQSLTREHGGLGIGLAIAKGMVELCGGDITVDSRPGQGSKFTFTIPV